MSIESPQIVALSTEQDDAEQEVPEAPDYLGEPGRELWSSVLGAYDLTVAERLVLLTACSAADAVARLAEQMQDEPLTTTNFKGDAVASAPFVEHRMQSQALQRAIASLRLPDEQGERPQRRGGMRGRYTKAVS